MCLVGPETSEILSMVDELQWRDHSHGLRRVCVALARRPKWKSGIDI